MILDEIAEKTRARVEEDKKNIPFVDMRNEAERLVAELSKENCPKLFPFYQALKSPGISFICEVKKASPSKGVIAEEFPYLQIAKEYEIAGASAISCLTEPYYFQGKDTYLKEITKHVTIPVLRKDFTVDPYMIYQARTLGASAILLICSLLSQSELEEYQAIATELGMSALVEAHDEREVEMALRADASIIGVNNRNLKDFSVDVGNSGRLRSLVPDGVLFVAESGIRTPEEVAALSRERVDAVLIGETLMRAENKRTALEELKSRL